MLEFHPQAYGIDSMDATLHFSIDTTSHASIDVLSVFQPTLRSIIEQSLNRLGEPFRVGPLYLAANALQDAN